MACSDIREDEDNDTAGDIYYNGSPDDHENERRYLKTRYDRADNSLDLFTLECQSILYYSNKQYRSEVGLNIKHVNLKNRLDEYYVEVRDSSMYEQPQILDERQRLGINSYSGYVQNTIALDNDLWANLGLRLLYYDYNDEVMLSPSAVLRYCPTVSEELHLGWGCYYQPPLFYELRNKDIGGSEPLGSQRSMHYVMGWEHTPKPELSVEVEAYYKDLDRLIPYHIEELRLEYADNNDHEGYAYGLDVLVKGEAADGLNSWIGYSYLNSKEREKAGGVYVRSLLDQTHTLQVFLQDKVPKRENVQAHLLFLLGSGFLYHPRVANVNPETGETELMVDMKSVENFPRYFRADVGMSGRFKVSKSSYVTVAAELLNYFDNRNVSTYSFYQVFPGSKTPTKLPHILTRRTFNIGVRLEF